MTPARHRINRSCRLCAMAAPHAYEAGAAGLTLIGERTADGTIIRSTAAG